MKFRWKLLLLLLGITIVPVVSLRTFGIHNVHLMSKALVEEVRKRQAEDADHRLRLAINDYSKNIGTVRKQVEMALFYQLLEIRRILQKELSSGGSDPTLPCLSGENATLGLNELDIETGAQRSDDADALCHFAPPSLDAATAECYNSRFKPMFSLYKALSQYLGGLVLKQYVGLENGFFCEYPCPEGEGAWSLRGEGEQLWYSTALRDKMSPWSRPFRDEGSGRFVMAVSLPLEREDDSVVGVASLLVPLDSLLEKAYYMSELPEESRTYLWTLAYKPETDVVGARILASASNRKETPGDPGENQSGEWLASSDSEEFDAMTNDIARRQYGIRKMSFEGQVCFWAYGPLLHQGSAFVFVVPEDRLLSERHPVLTSIQKRLKKVEMYTAGFLFFLVLAGAVLALAFSRTVTRPLEELSKAFQRLAKGDFDTQVSVKSRDEFGDMGRVFNRVGPQLKDHYRTRRALEVAMEIQQNLLPESAPRLSGLDIHGMTVFSDETGGDYFDFLCADDDQGRSRLCVAVGDVSDHGIPSALLMATARGLLRMRAATRGPMEQILADVNREFSKDVGDSGRFMTFFLARIDRNENRVEYVRAGHDPAILYDPADDSFRELGGGRGLPLGVSENAKYEVCSCEIKTGQIIHIGTDGIWEARNSQGETFGKERLRNVLRQNADEPAEKIVAAIADAVWDFYGDKEQEDDITPVIVKIR